MTQESIERSRTYYEVLQLDATCSPELLKTRYRELAREHHPDQLGHLSAEDQDEAAAVMAAINEAYDTLSDPHLRSVYDQRLLAEATAKHTQAEPAQVVPPKKPIFAKFLVALVIGGVVALWYDSTRSDKRGFSEEFAPIIPLVNPYVHKDRTQPGPSIKELMQSPEGTLIKRALQPEMTPENCLRAFPNRLQER